MSKFSSAQLMSGMAAAVNFLAELQKRIQANGGDPEVIQWLTMPPFDNRLDWLARTAISLFEPIQPIPFSLIQAEARKRWREVSDRDQHHRESMRFLVTYDWALAIPTFVQPYEQIPVIEFWRDHPSGRTNPLPDEIRKQIEGKPLRPPLKVKYWSDWYVVCTLSDRDGNVIKDGDVLAEHSIEQVKIVAAKFIDLEN